MGSTLQQRQAALLQMQAGAMAAGALGGGYGGGLGGMGGLGGLGRVALAGIEGRRQHQGARHFAGCLEVGQGPREFRGERRSETVQPFGLDLCSGVRTDGKLDLKKLERFFIAVS